MIIFGLPLRKRVEAFHSIKKPKKETEDRLCITDLKPFYEGFETSTSSPAMNTESNSFARLSKDRVTKQYQSYVDQWIPTQNLTDERWPKKFEIWKLIY